jgi:hypothetical protein
MFHGSRPRLNIRALFGVPAQIPAGLISRLREERMRARLRLRRIEHVFGLAAFFADRIVVIHDNRSVRIPIRRDANAEDQKIDGESQPSGAYQRESAHQKHSSQPDSERRSEIRFH